MLISGVPLCSRTCLNTEGYSGCTCEMISLSLRTVKDPGTLRFRLARVAMGDFISILIYSIVLNACAFSKQNKMEFNKNELKVLWNAFNSSDIDGDGVLSRNDLRITGGLESDEEVETLFNALKGAAGNTENSEVVTFEEFSLGVVDFPFLLEHFKKEYEELIENT